MAEARKQDSGMDTFPGNERPTGSIVTDPTTSRLPHLVLETWDPSQPSHIANKDPAASLSSDTGLVTETEMY